MAFKRLYNVFVAESGVQAIDILNNENIHLIVTDQKMPGMTGTELLQKTIDDHPEIIRIILTGFSDIEAIVQAVNKCGIYKYITKPYDQADMKLVLDKALELYKVKREKTHLINELELTNKNLELKVKERTLNLEESNKRLTDGLVFAQTVQECMLPKEADISDAYADAFVINRPKDFVGGDFFWFRQLEGELSHTSVLAVVDCMGHGVAGALLSMIGETQLDEITSEKVLPNAETILTKLDDKLRSALARTEDEGHGATMDASLVIVDKDKKTIKFSGAKLDLVYIKEGKVVRVKGTRRSLGSSWNEKVKYETRSINLEGITEIYLFSDGFQDQFNSENTKKFGSRKLYELIESVHKMEMPLQKKHIINVLDDWKKDAEQIDDITLIGVRI